MKKTFIVLATLVCLNSWADKYTAVINCINVGTCTVPTLTQNGGAQVNILYNVTVQSGSPFQLGVNVTGLATGQSAANWVSDGSYIPSSISLVSASPNVSIVSCTGPVPDVNQSPIWTVDFSFNCGPCYTNLYFTILNSDSESHTFDVMDVNNGGQVEMLTMGVATPVAPTVNPGQSQQFHWYGPCDEAYRIGVYEVTYTGSLADGTAQAVYLPVPGVSTTGEPDGSSTVPTTPASGAGGTFPTGVTYSTGTNNPDILWDVNGVDVGSGSGSGGNFNFNWNDANLIAAVEEGDDAIYDATVKNGIQSHADANVLAQNTASTVLAINGVTAAVNGVNTSVTAVTAAVNGNGSTAHADATAVLNAIRGQTNAITVNANQATNVNVLNFPLNTFVGMSNLLASQSDSSLSNVVGNMQSGLSNLIAGLQTSISNAVTGTNQVIDMVADGALTSISNGFAQLVNGTNADIATETTQKGLSNLLGVLAGQGTNLACILTNLSGIVSNGAALGNNTNLAQETTLTGISNILANLYDTNNLPTTNSLLALASDSALQGSNLLAGIVGSDAFGVGSDNSSSLGDSGPLQLWTMSIAIPFMQQSFTFDMNPFHLPWVVSLAAFVRNFIGWFCAVSLTSANIYMLLNSVNVLASSKQASGNSAIPGINSGVAVAMAIAITGVCLALPMYASDWFGASGLLNTITSHPFKGPVAAPVGVSIYIADQFFPIAFMVWCVMVGIGFRASLTAICYSCMTIIRFLCS